MRDPACRREMFIRGSITTIMAAIAYVFLRAEPWVFILPLAVVALVWLKWRVGSRGDDEDDSGLS